MLILNGTKYVGKHISETLYSAALPNGEICYWQLKDQEGFSFGGRGARTYRPLNEYLYPPLKEMQEGQQFSLQGQKVIAHWVNGSFIGFEILSKQTLQFVVQVEKKPGKFDLPLGYRIV